MKFDMTKNKSTMTGALFLGALIWGAGTVFIQICLQGGLETALQMFFRFWIGAACLGIACIRNLHRINRRMIFCGALCGTFLFFAFFIFTVGVENTTPANASFLSASNIMIIPFLSWAMLKLRPEKKIFLGCGICLVGVAVLSLQFDGGLHFTLGDLLVLLSAVFFSFHACFVAKLGAGFDPALFTFVQMVAVAIWSTVTLPVSGADFSVVGKDIPALICVVILGVFNTALCSLIQMNGQRVLPPTRVSLILSTESLFGAVFSVLMGYDPFSLRLVLGGGIMMLAILLVETDLLTPKKKKPVSV